MSPIPLQTTHAAQTTIKPSLNVSTIQPTPTPTPTPTPAYINPVTGMPYGYTPPTGGGGGSGGGGGGGGDMSFMPDNIQDISPSEAPQQGEQSMEEMQVNEDGMNGEEIYGEYAEMFD